VQHTDTTKEGFCFIFFFLFFLSLGRAGVGGGGGGGGGVRGGRGQEGGAGARIAGFAPLDHFRVCPMACPRPYLTAKSPARWQDFAAAPQAARQSFVVFPALTGLVCAGPCGEPDPWRRAILCIAVGAGASAALTVGRRRYRPPRSPHARPAVPAGGCRAADAMARPWCCRFFSVMLTGMALKLAARPAAFTIFFYAVVYTVCAEASSRRRNIVIGGLDGRA